MIYKKIKVKKNLEFLANMGLYSQISIVFSSNTYYLLYNTINLITFDDIVMGPSDTMIDLAITANVIYALVTIILISYYKDVIFAIIMIIIEIGYIIDLFSYSKSLSADKIVSLVILSLIFLSILASVIKYGKLVFGYEPDHDVEHLMCQFKNNNKSALEV